MIVQWAVSGITMPIERVPVVHKFGIISHSQRLQLQERLLKQSYLKSIQTKRNRIELINVKFSHLLELLYQLMKFIRSFLSCPKTLCFGGLLNMTITYWRATPPIWFHVLVRLWVKLKTRLEPGTEHITLCKYASEIGLSDGCLGCYYPFFSIPWTRWTKF